MTGGLGPAGPARSLRSQERSGTLESRVQRPRRPVRGHICFDLTISSDVCSCPTQRQGRQSHLDPCGPPFYATQSQYTSSPPTALSVMVYEEAYSNSGAVPDCRSRARMFEYADRFAGERETQGSQRVSVSRSFRANPGLSVSLNISAYHPMKPRTQANACMPSRDALGGPCGTL